MTDEEYINYYFGGRANYDAYKADYKAGRKAACSGKPNDPQGRGIGFEVGYNDEHGDIGILPLPPVGAFKSAEAGAA